jgi:hypothetical protein
MSEISNIIILANQNVVKARQYGEILFEKYSLDTMNLDNPFMGMHNILMLNRDTIGLWKKYWDSKEGREFMNKQKISNSVIIQQNGERIMSLNRMLFIQMMSVIEYSFKKNVTSHPKIIGNCEEKAGRIYLSKIINNAYKSEFLTKDNKALWFQVISIRNDLVHNNGIPDQNHKVILPKLKFNKQSGKMLEGDLSFFLLLVDWLIDNTFEILNEFHNRIER